MSMIKKFRFDYNTVCLLSDFRLWVFPRAIKYILPISFPSAYFFRISLIKA